MVTPELLEFMRAELAGGMPESELAKLLLAEGGWDEHDIDEAIRALRPQAPAPVMQTLVAQKKEEVTAPTPSTAPQVQAQEKPIVPPDTLRDTAIAQPPMSPPVTTQNEAPAKRISISPGEDFLGIFEGGDSVVILPEQKQPPAQVASVTVGTDTPVVLRVKTREDTRLPEPPQEPSMQTQNMTPRALSETETGKPTTPEGASTQIKLTPRFNLEKVRGISAGASSVAKFLTNDPKQPQAPDTILSGVLKTPESHVHAHVPGGTEHTTVLGKRTMASDILLRGIVSEKVVTPTVTQTAKSDMPEVGTGTEATVAPVMEVSPPAQNREMRTPETADEVMRKNRIRRIFTIVVGVLAVLTLLGVVGFFAMRMMGGGSSGVLTAALGMFLDAKTVSYDMNAKFDLMFSERTRPEVLDRFSLTLSSLGSVENNMTGYGDGVHRIALAGKFSSGNFALPTKLNGNVVVRGGALYFNLTDIPESSTLDRALFEKYWVKVDIAEIASELAFSGILAQSAQYGNFSSGGKPDEHFVAFMREYAPLESVGDVTEEASEQGVLNRITFRINPERGLQFVLAMYRTYAGKELVLSEDERLRLSVALEKFQGEVWIKKDTGALAQIVLRATLKDDVIVDDVVTGSIAVDIVVPGINTSVEFPDTTPALTLADLKVEMEKYRLQKLARDRDQLRADRMQTVINALRAYREQASRYPTTLPELYDAGVLASSTIPISDLTGFAYVAYVEENPSARQTKCTAISKSCAYFHVGVSLENADTPALLQDADVRSEIRGADERGCTGEDGRYCLDFNSRPASSTEVIASSTPSQR